MRAPEPFLAEAAIRRAEEIFRQTLEHYHHARTRFQEQGSEFMEREGGQIEDVVSACEQMNLRRAAVEGARLRLKLLGAEESVVDIELEYRRRHKDETVPGERVDDLGNLEDAESELLEADVRFREAYTDFTQLLHLFDASQIGPGDMLTAIRDLAEARAEKTVARARVALISGSIEEAIGDLLPEPTVNTLPM